LPTYLEAKSSPKNSQYFWAYRVIIENQGLEGIQLLSRHWMITNAHGELTEVKGPGVVGEDVYKRQAARKSAARMAIFMTNQRLLDVDSEV